MSYPPLHFRKMHSKFPPKTAMLQGFVRGFALLLKHSCDDQGRIELDGKTPVEAITRLCAMHPKERRRIAGDITELIRVGWLRHDGEALVVVQQEDDWEQLDSSRASKTTSTRRWHGASQTLVERQHDADTTLTQHPKCVTNGNHSSTIRQQDKTRSDQKREDKKKEDLSPDGDAAVAHDSDSPPTTPSLDQLETPARRSVVQVEPADPPEVSASECDLWGLLPDARSASSHPAPADAAKIQPAQVPLLVLETQEPANLSTPLLRVWEAYVEARLATMKGSRRPALDDKRKQAIATKLKTFTEEDLISACRGIFKDPFHIEKNYKFATVKVALSSADNIERFMNEDAKSRAPPPREYAPPPPPAGFLEFCEKNPMTDAERERIRQKGLMPVLKEIMDGPGWRDANLYANMPGADTVDQ